MSKSKTKSYRGKGDTIKPATVREEKAIREEIEEFARTTGGTAVQHLHIQRLGSEEPDPLCGNSGRPSDLITKPIGVYPLRYLPICSYCLHEWRERQ